MSESLRVTSILLAALVVADLVTYLKARAFLAKARSAEAVVVGQRPYQEQRRTRYSQIVQYPFEGRNYEGEIRAGVSYPTGTRLTVYFSHDAPASPRIKLQVFRATVVLSILSLLVFLVWGYELCSMLLK